MSHRISDRRRAANFLSCGDSYSSLLAALAYKFSSTGHSHIDFQLMICYMFDCVVILPFSDPERFLPWRLIYFGKEHS